MRLARTTTYAPPSLLHVIAVAMNELGQYEKAKELFLQDTVAGPQPSKCPQTPSEPKEAEETASRKLTTQLK